MTSARGEEILDKVRAVPPGCVTTYGDLCPEAPRLAGSVLAACADAEVPWQRVVRADGSLAKGDRQRDLLREEGTAMRGSRVDMERAWVDVNAIAAGVAADRAGAGKR